MALPEVTLPPPVVLPPHPLFGEDRVHTAALEVHAETWEALLESREKTWVKARLVWNGRTVGEVGLRLKGESTRRTATGSARPMKLDFDRFAPGGRLHGLDALHLHRSPLDPGGLRDPLAYAAWREAGVPASRTAPVEVALNGEELGVYTAVEPVDARWLATFYPPGDGPLYKPRSGLTPGAWSSGRPAVRWLKEGADPDGERFFAVMQSLEEQRFDTLDLDSTVLQLAGDTALGNGDSYAHALHNYYLYAPTDGPFRWVPWDLDRAWTTSATCTREGDRAAWSAMVADPELEARYRATVLALLDGPASAERLLARIDVLAPLYEASDAEVSDLKTRITRHEQVLRRVLDRPCR